MLAVALATGAATARSEDRRAEEAPTTDAPPCATAIAVSPMRAKFDAEGGLDRLPRDSSDPTVVTAAAAWLRWHRFSYRDIGAILRERGLAPKGGLEGLTDRRVRTLVAAYRPFAFAKADALEARRKHTPLEAARILQGANVGTAAIARYLNDRGIAWRDPTKKKTADDADDETAPEDGPKEPWTGPRVATLLESREQPGAIYNEQFEDEEAMGKVSAEAWQIAADARAARDERLRTDRKVDPTFAMPLLSDEAQNTVALAMNYCRHRALLARDCAGPWNASADNPLLRTALSLEAQANELNEVLWLSNMRLVKATAKSFMLQYELDDLLQEGGLALRRAINTYDVRVKVRPSTWMTNVVKRGFLQLVKHDSTQGRAGARNNVSLSSLGRANSEDGSTPMPLEDQYVDDPLESLVREEGARRLLKALDKLDPRERLVLRLRYGFVDDEKWELRRIGERMGLTKERVRQIESEAIAKLPAILAKLKERRARRRTTRPGS